MELSAHPAMAADARLRRDGDGHELRVVAQATFLLVSGPTEIVSAEDLDEDAASWLEMAAVPDGASVVVVGGGAGASRVTASDQEVRLGPEGRGDRAMPRAALAPGAAIAVETDDAGTVATRLPEQGPRAWLEVGGVRRPLALQPFAVRIDLVGLRLSIAWCASERLEHGAIEGSRLVVHTDAAPSGEAPRSARPPAPARAIAVVDAPRDSTQHAAPPPVEWDVDSTVSIDGPAPTSLPLPFVGSPPAEVPVAAQPLPPPPAPPRRSIGQVLAERGASVAAVVPPPLEAEPLPARAGRMRMDGASLEPHGPRASAAVPPFAMLHVEAGVSARLRRGTSWRPLLQAPSRAAQRAADQAGDDKAAGRDARDAVAALRLAAAVPLPTLQAELARAVDDGLFVAPLVVIEGELELPLDEVEMLRATAEAIAPLRSLDRRVEEAHDRAKPFLEAAWLDAAVADAERAALRGALAALGRGSTADALDAQVERQVERKLRRDRKHAQRTWNGAPHVVGVVAAGGGADAARALVLLPRACVDRLPIARRFRARLLVEVHPPHEPDLGDAPLIVAVAIAREVPT